MKLLSCSSALARRCALSLLIALLCALSLSALADDVIVTASTTINAENAADYQNKNLIVRGATVTVDHSAAFSVLNLTGLKIENTGTLTHTASSEWGLNLNVSGDINILTGSVISATGRGYPAGGGQGAGTSNASDGGGGAAYGGEGTIVYSPSGTVYGDIREPSALGSGGGSGYAGSYLGGAGGGAIRLTVSGVLRVDGLMTADGADSPPHGGGGSGGSIYLSVGSLTGSGTIRSVGGYGNNRGGGGGGGRIALYHNDLAQWSGTLWALGNRSGDYGTRAGAGTVFLKQSGQQYGDLWVNNGGNAGFGTVLSQDINFDNIRVFGKGLLVPNYGQLLELHSVNVTVETFGTISVAGRGYAAGAGPGAGANNANNDGGGGGAYGGEGTIIYSPSGTVYGDLREPVAFGSGGGYGYTGSYPGGAGGGALRMTVTGTLRVDGLMTADGADSPPYGGGGSGGSIYLSVGSLAGSGVIRAVGGYGNNRGGGGGGGRIAVYHNDLAQWSGTLWALGNRSSDFGTRAAAGTVYFKQTAQRYGDLWINNSGNAGLATVLSGDQTFDNVRVFGAGSLAPPYEGSLSLFLTGDCRIEDGIIGASGRGYGPSRGPGAGGNNVTDGGAGGSYGGRGGSIYSALSPDPYGSEQLPIDFGSGGGYGYNNSVGYSGGAGGGAVRLVVNGTLLVNGRLEVNGNDSSPYGGGGSGGSLLLRVGALSGNGTIRANGGYGNNRGGGGGGGRIALYYITKSSWTGLLEAKGNRSNDFGGYAQNGTVYEQMTTGNVTVSFNVSTATIASGQTAAGSVNLSGPAPTGGLSIALSSSNNATVSVPSSVFIAEGDTAATFTLTAGSVTANRTATVSARLWDQNSSQTITVQPWLGSIKINPGSVVGGSTARGTLTLNVPAPAGGLSVLLSKTDDSVTFPDGNTLTIPGGTTTITFNIATGTVSQAKAVGVKAGYLAEIKSATLYVNPGSVTVRSIKVAPAAVLSGDTATGVVTISGVAPTGGVLVALSSDKPGVASVPAFIRVPAGKTSVSFAVPTTNVSSPQSVTLSATLGGTVMTQITVRPPAISGLAILPNVLVGGDTAIGVVTLDGIPNAPVTVTIFSNNSKAIPDTTIIIPAGSKSGTFFIDTVPVTSNVMALITARANGLSKSQFLMITP